MTRLEDIRGGALVRGIEPNGAVHVVSVEWIGDQAINAVYRDEGGSVRETTLYRDDEHRLELDARGRPFSFDADGALLRLVTEAHRIRLAHHFDPYLAIHTSLVDPLPHQISAVYGEMLPRQPLRFLLADDPGAGKTIMAGLLMKELIARGDLERCLIVAPGSLVEQWQDELGEKFRPRIRHPDARHDRNRAVRQSVRAQRPPDRSARYAGAQRRSSGQAVRIAGTGPDHLRRGTPHVSNLVRRRRQIYEALPGRPETGADLPPSPFDVGIAGTTGKEEDFQLFMALLDGDRFEGRFRDGVHHADTQGHDAPAHQGGIAALRRAAAFSPSGAPTRSKYDLSPKEAALYAAVTDYVRTGMNRVQRFAGTDGRKRNTVGFALQILQRRLASSPAAIHRSLKRRRERLENELAEARLADGSDGPRLIRPAISGDMLNHIDEYDQEDVDDLEELIATGRDHGRNGRATGARGRDAEASRSRGAWRSGFRRGHEMAATRPHPG